MEIPIWCKAVLSVAEASDYADGLSHAIIRAEAYKGIAGRGSFNAYMSGNKVCIPRVPFERWLEEQGRLHTVFSHKQSNAEREELKEPTKRARSKNTVFIMKRTI